MSKSAADDIRAWWAKAREVLPRESCACSDDGACEDHTYVTIGLCAAVDETTAALQVELKAEREARERAESHDCGGEARKWQEYAARIDQENVMLATKAANAREDARAELLSDAAVDAAGWAARLVLGHEAPNFARALIQAALQATETETEK